MNIHLSIYLLSCGTCNEYTLQHTYKVDSMVIALCVLDAGTLRPTTGPGNIRDEDLTPEEIGLALLPASLFETLTDEEIGMFFLLYENASPFPVAGEIGSIIGSPVVSATVVASEQTSFRNLREPVTIVVRLNQPQEGVS